MTTLDVIMYYNKTGIRFSRIQVFHLGARGSTGPFQLAAFIRFFAIPVSHALHKTQTVSLTSLEMYHER